ncbi:N alpha-acetyl-transferase [Sparganum proliferum]
MPSFRQKSERRTPNLKKSLSDNETIVDSANLMTAADLLAEDKTPLDCCCYTFSVRCAKASELSPTLQAELFSILEHNMKDFYCKSSWGWDAEAKRRELFAPESRLLVCFFGRQKDACAAGRHTSLRESPPPTGVCGFVHFRFECDSHRAVLYCYEIQLLESARGVRLGHQLVDHLFEIAARTSMQRVMLTVFKFNTHAYNFFGRLGFKVDSTDPCNYGKFVDYSIMSRRVS